MNEKVKYIEENKDSICDEDMIHLGTLPSGGELWVNKLVGEKISIIEDTPGVTRDRIYSEASYGDYRFSVIDTGGIDASTEKFNDVIKVQAEIAIDEADIVLFIVDGKDGLTSNDFIVRDIINNNYAYIQVAKTIDNGIVNDKGIPVTEEREYRPLESIMDNYCLSWFDVLTDNMGFKVIDETTNTAGYSLSEVLDKIQWADVSEGYAYYNGVLYNINKIYENIRNINDTDKIDKFAVLIYPNTDNIFDNINYFISINVK